MLQTLGEDETAALLKRFTCSRGRDEEEFLHEKAIMMEKKHACRTYIFSSDDGIVGFLTLGLKCTTINDDTEISRNMRSKLSINPRTKIAQCFLLAQLCRSDNSPKGYGKSMMSTAFKFFTMGDEMFGCRAVRLDCDDKLISYYRDFGFVPIRKDSDNGLTQMVCTL